MVHPAFDIRNNDLAGTPENCRLLIEISGQSLNYILFARSPDQLFLLRQYRLYTTGDKGERDILEEIISGDPVLQEYSGKSIMVYNFPEASIFPSALYNPNLKSPVTSLVYGEAGRHLIFDEEIEDWEMRNVYCISKDIHSLFKEKFNGSQYWHLYTMMLRWSSGSEQKRGSYTRVIFYNDKFIAAFFNDDRLQLIQTFTYQTPEDVAYYLLLICKQFGIQQQEMVLFISGLIDTQSALHSELLKYFSQVHYEGVPVTYDTNGLLDDYPSHYFSPLLKMSLCV